MPNAGFHLILIELLAIATLTAAGCYFISVAIETRAASPVIEQGGI